MTHVFNFSGLVILMGLWGCCTTSSSDDSSSVMLPEVLSETIMKSASFASQSDTDGPSEGEKGILTETQTSNFIDAIISDLAAKQGRFEARRHGFGYTVNGNINRYSTFFNELTLDKTFVQSCERISGTPEICEPVNTGYTTRSKTRHCRVSKDGTSYKVAEYDVSWTGPSRFETPGVGHNGNAHPKRHFISFSSSQFGDAIGRKLGALLNADTSFYDRLPTDTNNSDYDFIDTPPEEENEIGWVTSGGVTLGRTEDAQQTICTNMTLFSNYNDSDSSIFDF